MSTTILFKLTHSLQKVFANSQEIQIEAISPLVGLTGETISFQLAYYGQSDDCFNDCYFKLKLESSISSFISVRKVDLVPSGYPAPADRDEHYLKTEAGMFPDLLSPYVEGEAIRAIPSQWRSIWIDIQLTEELVASEYQIKIICETMDNQELSSFEVPVQVLPYTLPEQTLMHTEWFHVDCLANYYNTEVFSEKHWKIIESFIESANKHGVNMLLTPVFTPPLDTVVGGERKTVQLVDVIVNGENYEFDFTKLDRWIELCKKYDIKYIEISHLFTQWGAKHAPKIMATIDGEYKQLFGWTTDATGVEYSTFLRQFIPALKIKLDSLNVLENTWFHISDEPNISQKESYRSAKKLVDPLLEGCNVIDALSNLEYYNEGIIANPAVAVDHIHPFIDAKVEKLWAYYCTSQCVDVSNRFMSMPSYRNRIIGLQLYLYQIKGFLHWGFNFYNSQFSLKEINPFQVTDAGEAFPSGDSFLVYPGANGKPLESIRGMIFNEALYDLRALQYLETLVGRDEVIRVIYEDIDETITFSSYPHSSEYLLTLRQKVNKYIQEAKAK